MNKIFSSKNRIKGIFNLLRRHLDCHNNNFGKTVRFRLGAAL